MKICSKNSVIIFISIIFILLVGIFIRLDSVGLTGVPLENKGYYQDSNGQNYMYDMDSYYNYRLTENLLKTGHIYESINNNQTIDTLSYYPPGVPFDYPPLIAYISVLFYKLINYFISVSLITVCFWIPSIIGPLSGVIAFLFIYRIKRDSIGILGGLVAGLLIVLSPFYFMRTVPGFFDTDMFIILFSLLTVWLLFESIRSSGPLKQIILILCTSLSMLLFSLAWAGWQLLYFIIFAAAMVYYLSTQFPKILVNQIHASEIDNSEIKYNKKKKTKNQNINKWNSKLLDFSNIEGKNRIKTGILIFVFLVVSIILIILINGLGDIIKIIYGPLAAFKLSSNQLWGSWPDPYSTIGELQIPRFSDIILGIGPGLIILGISGIVMVVFNLIKSIISSYSSKLKFNPIKSQSVYFMSILFTIWVVAGILTLFKGIRFELMLIGPLSIVAGFTFIKLSNYLKNLILKNQNDENTDRNKRINDIRENKNRRIFSAVLNIILILMVITPSLVIVESHYQNLIPRANDDLWDSAVWISNHTPKNTVIITDWVHGHFFAAISHRPVNFDGRLGYIETIQDRSWAYKNSGMDIRIPNVYRQYWQNKALSTSNFTLSQGILRMISTSGDQAYLLLEDYTKNQSLSVKILEDILGLNRDDALLVLNQKYHINNATTLKIIDYTHPTTTTTTTTKSPYVLITSDEFIEKGYWVFFYGSWDFNNLNHANYPYSFGNIIKNTSIPNNIIKSDDGTIINLEKDYASWNNENPNKLIIIKDNKTFSKVINRSSDFNIYLIPGKNKTVVLNKKYENSVFVDLVLKNQGLNGFKLIYNKGKVYLWETNT
ncbi:MAG: hypothetical protein CVV28_09485 [Methanobacteriales archaeon HGW-Methanobacteriales-1]|nr:MAG: hypothetical protein CVV28_09485 [Methanobacteriales archaeon HGW-Methanobacteriales-1]